MGIDRRPLHHHVSEAAVPRVLLLQAACRIAVAGRDAKRWRAPAGSYGGVVDVRLVGEDDTVFNPLGARGIGEIGITGVPAAVANAIHHATGTRIRDLPITLDKLI
jgi:xanthine dehydrogenase YagR molybdenum-binding subunit